VLRVTYGVVPIAAGLDKFTNLLVDWRTYLSPLAARVLPVEPGTFMRAAGVVEIAVGLVILLGISRFGGYVAAIWLALIALNLLSSGRFLDVAVRDLAMAVGAFALGRLAEARVAVTEGHTEVARGAVARQARV
jgi:uncharacterized membrane protein YphA (DoxX/SURF4 family)